MGQSVLASDGAGVGPSQSEELTIAVKQGQVVFLRVQGFNLTGDQGSYTFTFTNLDQFETASVKTLFFPTQGDRRRWRPQSSTGGSNIPSVLATNTSSADTLGVLGPNADGTFQAERQFDLGPGLAGNLAAGNRQVGVVDLNGDGILDAVVPNFRSSDVSVLLGNGDGTFQPERRFDAVTSPDGLVTGDFTGDGKMDVVVVQIYAQGSGRLEFRLAEGPRRRHLPAARADADGLHARRPPPPWPATSTATASSTSSSPASTTPAPSSSWATVPAPSRTWGCSPCRSRPSTRRSWT